MKKKLQKSQKAGKPAANSADLTKDEAKKTADLTKDEPKKPADAKKKSRSWCPCIGRSKPPLVTEPLSDVQFRVVASGRRRLAGTAPKEQTPKTEIDDASTQKKPRKQLFCTNKVSTAKYTVLTFLPLFLFDQFKRAANFFFLVISIIQQVPNISPTGRWTTAFPLTFITLVAMFKELMEGVRRYQTDRKMNEHPVTIYEPEGTSSTQWKRIKVGDLLRISDGELFPADLILISSSEPSGMAYVETANLDGETNLKIRTSKPLTMNLLSPEQLWQTDMEIECQQPNANLYEFNGKLRVWVGGGAASSNERKTTRLGPNQLMLRGARLKNTDWVNAMVVYTGKETKLMQNSRKIPWKSSNFDRRVNRMIAVLFFVVFLTCIVGSALHIHWERTIGIYHWYIGSLAASSFLGGKTDNQTESERLTTEVLLLNFASHVATCVVLFNGLIPISLLVTYEGVRYFQAKYISMDLSMYYEPTDIRACARTSTLNEELGQVKYLFSDKTGTLTANKMALRMCSVAGRLFGDTSPAETDEHSKIDNEPEITNEAKTEDSGASDIFGGIIDWQMVPEKAATDESLRNFMLAVAICHTVVPELKKDNSEAIYIGSSPDEMALVKGAKNVGFRFHTRTPSYVVVNVLGKDEQFDILYVIEFNSNRQRMGVIVRDSRGDITLFEKGADTVIFNPLGKGHEATKAAVSAHLLAFAKRGYRTLCFSMSRLSTAFYEEWQARLLKQLSADQERRSAGSLSHVVSAGGPGEASVVTKAEDELMPDLEVDMQLLGATAIEDKLQDRVVDTIESLLKAGIHVWVLTGDKRETAVNIARSSRLITVEMPTIFIQKDTLQDVQTAIEFHLGTMEAQSETKDEEKTKKKKEKKGATVINDVALVIDGKSLGFALSVDVQPTFAKLALRCRSVICCRVAPKQKAAVVEMVRQYADEITLAIGDGANDVAMIQAAHVGVAITGEEGLQAAAASDYSIAQFSFLKKLLLVHGCWNYQRSVKLTLYTFYKNNVIFFCQLFFYLNAFSGQTFVERWLLSIYNLFVTNWLPCAMGVFDQPASVDTAMIYPELYKMSQDKNSFSWKVFFMWQLNGFLHSLIVFLLLYACFSEEVYVANGRQSSWVIDTSYMYLAILEVDQWNYMMLMAAAFGPLLLMAFIFAYSYLYPLSDIGPEVVDLVGRLMSSPVMMFNVLVFIPVSTLVLDLFCKSVRRDLRPTLAERVAAEVSRGAPSSSAVLSKLFGRLGLVFRAVQLTSSQSEQQLAREDSHGFAFSQEEHGAISQKQMLEAYDSTKPKIPGSPLCDSPTQRSELTPPPPCIRTMSARLDDTQRESD